MDKAQNPFTSTFCFHPSDSRPLEAEIRRMKHYLSHNPEAMIEVILTDIAQGSPGVGRLSGLTVSVPELDTETRQGLFLL